MKPNSCACYGSNDIHECYCNLNNNNMKQLTAVEELYQTLWKKHDFLIPRNVYEEAKEMEKKQIDNALTDRYNMGNLTFEEYYNKIYKTI